MAEPLGDLAIALRAIIDKCEAVSKLTSTATYGQDQGANYSTALISSFPTSGDLLASKLYQLRRTRDKEFGVAGLFSEPAWDILLDLYDAHLTNKRVQVTSACIAAAVPSTTALRWIGILEMHGLVFRDRDASDARRSWLGLTEKAQDIMAGILTSSRKR